MRISQRLGLLSLVFLLLSSGCNFPGIQSKIGSTPAGSAFGENPTAAFTPSATPFPTPTPTPLPAVRVAQADQALFQGQTELSRQEYYAAALNSQDAEIQASALLGIGRSYFEEKNYSQAIETFNSLIYENPANQSLAYAYYFLAEVYRAQDQPAEAALAYAKFLELKPGIIDDIIQARRADALMDAANYPSAIEAYQAAILASPGEDAGWLKIKIGHAYAAEEDYTNAVKIYLDAYDNSQNSYIKAQANLLIGQIYTLLGFPEQAYARYQDSITNFPEAYDSYTGLVALVDAGVPVSDLDRGITDYYAGQNGYAAEALVRYLASTPEHDGSAHEFRALALREMGQYTLAIQEWQALIRDHPDDSYWSEAWQNIAFTQWAYIENFDAAADTLKNYVAMQPNAPDAAETLFTAGRILERGDRLTQATEIWARLIDEYPSAEISSRGLFLAGITQYRLKNYSAALTIFQRTAALSVTPYDQSSALLWVGKTQVALGDQQAAASAWQQSTALDPTGYYSDRALELLENRAPFTSNQTIDLGIDLTDERESAEVWLRAAFKIGADVDLSSHGDLDTNPSFIRGMTLWEIGEYQLARGEFETLREQLQDDPVNTYRFMNIMLGLGAYRPAIFASRQILNLAGMGDIQTLDAPKYFNHIRFGTYYKDLILQESTGEGFNPLFLFSLIRQESFFEGFVQSSAGARGLMQIIPATGADLANRYHWPENYTDNDLYNPSVNIRLGIKYLADQEGYFGGNLYAALAAYNGGPGNSKIWNDLAGNDPDLLLEIIRYEETQNYIKGIAEFMHLYQQFYAR